MYGAKLCLGLNPDNEIPYEEQIRLYRQVGFEGFFVNWTPAVNVRLLRKTADETGMLFQSIHGPFLENRYLWEPSEHSERVRQELIRCIRDCADNDVPIMVTHPYVGFENHEPNAWGLENLEQVVHEAEKLGVKLAFENAEGEEYLHAAMAHFKNCAAVGFCWDTGHELCYNFGRDMLELYGDRLVCTHLNDNLGVSDFEGKIIWTDDLHLLPFDGIADWQDMVRRLNYHGYDGCLTFELKRRSKPGRHDNDAYERMSVTEYITNAYMRACRVAALKQRMK